jgi:hypothetical protein
MKKVLIELGIILLFQFILAVLFSIIWNLSVPNIFESVSEVSWFESLCLIALYNLLTKCTIEINKKD